MVDKGLQFSSKIIVLSHKIALEIAKKEYRASRYIPVIVDYTSIYGAFGVGMLKQ